MRSLLNRHRRRSDYLNAILAVITTLVFIHILTQLALSPQPDRGRTGEGTVSNESSPAALAIAALNLFGITSGTISEAGKLELKGVVLSDRQTTSGAFLALSGKEDHFYPIGAALPGGGILSAIDAHHAIIRENGATQTLELKKNDASASQAATSALDNGNAVGTEDNAPDQDDVSNQDDASRSPSQDAAP